MPMVANACDAEEARKLCGPSTSVVELPIDDSWTRDSGPVFLLDEGGSLAASVWRFTAWGQKDLPDDQDAQLARGIARRLALPVVTSSLALEGGALLVDGVDHANLD